MAVAIGFAAVILPLIGLVAVWTQEAFLVPSLGSALFTQLQSPDDASARPYSLITAQVCGVLAGLVGVYVASANGAPPFMTGHPLVDARVLAVLIAVSITALGQFLLRATSHVGGATALVVAVGAEIPTFGGLGRLVAGILIAAALGEIGRRTLPRLEEGGY